MKYWVYKESRILGPFEKEAVSGLPGLDAGTLVCADDPAGGAWMPAGDISDLKGLSVGVIGPFEDFPSSAGLLDQLQIDAAGHIEDDDLIGSFAEELFQDASFKKGFGDTLSTGGVADEGALRRSREKISELTAQLEAMYRHISELEAAQTDLARRLAAKDLNAPGTTEAGPAKTFLSPAAEPIPGGPPPVAAVPESAPPPEEWPQVPAAGTPGIPSLSGSTVVPPAELPVIPSLSSAAAPVPPPVDAPLAAPEETPKKISFGKPKSFKIVPTVKSFKVMETGEAAPAAAPIPAPAAKVEPIIEPPAEVVPPPPPVVPVVLAPLAPPVPEPAPVPNPFTQPAIQEPAIVAPPAPTPVAPPPNTLSHSQPVPDLLSGEADATAQVPPPATMAQFGGVEAPVDDAVAARFAKPELAPATGEIKKPARSNKGFLIGGGVLVTLLIIVGVIFMLQPKEDLKRMATLDDGSAPIGLGREDGSVAPTPALEPAPALPPPGPPPEQTAAIEAVKDFPLDGGRGTVGRWLQYSYTADPNAGSEEWNASDTGDGVMLVEYRLVPSETGGKGALYLFEVVSNGLVIGKNIVARQMLAGSPPPDAPKAKKKPVKKVRRKRRTIIEEPKEVPLLPLPDSGELRPPAEDDGTFDSDTINSGI